VFGLSFNRRVTYYLIFDPLCFVKNYSSMIINAIGGVKRSLPIEIFFPRQRIFFPWAGRKFFLPGAYIRQSDVVLLVVKVFLTLRLVAKL
jgi:hypothetical protein